MIRFRSWWVIATALIVAVLVAMLTPSGQARANGSIGSGGSGGSGGSQASAGFPVANYTGLGQAQRANLLAIARDTWKFYRVDIDQATNLPMDNMTFADGSATPTVYGRYTSAADIGVYLWAVVSARDLGLISTAQAIGRITATLTEVSHLQRYDGFLYQWYDTTNGDVLSNPGQADCPAGAAPASSA